MKLHKPLAGEWKDASISEVLTKKKKKGIHAMIQIRILNFPEEHHTLTIGTHLNQSLADWLGKFPQRVSSSHLRDYATAPSSGRLSAQSVCIYLCSHTLPGMKIKSSANHFWWPPLTDKNRSLYCESAHIIEDLRIERLTSKRRCQVSHGSE